ncbi:MAG: hypothetical protein PWQ96_1138 [Clostridia bacterium]|jgi:hypothetical protein|nr:hypothetical protein [Clostridiales bacterium]MDK2985496.1 hypothetical protein [Clostridia bacterium]
METLEDILLGVALLAGLAFVAWWYVRKKIT